MEKIKEDLTLDQKNAFHSIVKFIRQDDHVFVLYGAAGTGKTFLVKKLVQAFICLGYKYFEIMGITPTHKACKVMKTMAPEISVTTISSFLAKRREHSYVGSRVYSAGTTDKSNYKLVILDEVSMVADADFIKIVNAIKAAQSHLIVIGDKYQIPAPSQRLSHSIIDGEHVLIKSDSIAFDTRRYNSYELTEIVRQQADSPIIRIATIIRENIYEDEAILPDEIPDYMKIKYVDLIEKFKVLFYLKQTCKIISYTNAKVGEFNKVARIAIFGENNASFYIGDILTGCTNMGLVENGRDYKVLSARQLDTGWIVLLEGAGTLFFPSIIHSAMNNLAQLAHKVNSLYSTKRDYARYMNAREQYYFLENVYEFNGKLILEDTFRAQHPLLFNCIKTIEKDELLKKRIEQAYPDILSTRCKDNKCVGDQELLCARYCIIEKDLNYGYACTAHKSQGSTFENVFVDMKSFDRIENRIIRGICEFKVKERNQLKYVACTRASNLLFFIE